MGDLWKFTVFFVIDVEQIIYYNIRMEKEKNMNRILTFLMILSLCAVAYFIAHIVVTLCVTDTGVEYNYCFQIILQNQDDDYKKRFIDGVDEFFSEGNSDESSLTNSEISFEKIVSGKKCCTEIVELNDYSEKELCDALKSAAYAHLDAVALQPGDSEEFKEAVSMAKDRGVDVIFYQSDVDSEEYSSLTQVYSYRELGKEAALKFAEQAIPGDVILIISGNHNTLSDRNISGSDNVYVSDYSIFQRACGVSDVLDDLQKSRHISCGLNVYYMNSTEKNMHYIIQKEIANYKNLSGIICLDERSTPFLISALLDNDIDLKGKTIIGYGNSDHSELYKNNGVISELIDDNAEEIGYDVAKELYSKGRAEK